LACAAPSEGIFDDVHLDHPISLGWYGGDIHGSRVVHVWFTFDQEAPFGMRCTVGRDF
jgi:hypothetical protein